MIVSKIHPSSLQRFDVVVFKGPDEASVPYVKRLIGLPGETVRIRAGEIEIRDNENSSFRICRKPPSLALALAQTVYDDRFRGPELPPRWRTLNPMPGSMSRMVTKLPSRNASNLPISIWPTRAWLLNRSATQKTHSLSITARMIDLFLPTGSTTFSWTSRPPHQPIVAKSP